MADLGAFLGAAGVGSAIGQAVVQLELETTKYQAEMKAMQGETAASTGSMSSLFSNLKGYAGAAMLGVGAAVVAGVAVSVKAASDLNEQINKTKVVFEDSADSVLEFSKTTAESLGVSETAALTAAGSFGQILDAAGLAEDATAKMSISLVGLASDLASFNNIDPTVSLEKLQAGLAGQARPLREVGVFLSAARVEAEAYGSGIAEVGTELTDAQKIQARYNIILEDTTKAQGDFQRTLGESLPNQMRVMKAELEDTAAKLGTAFLPLVLEAAKAVLELVEALGPLLDLIGRLGPAVHILAEAFQFLMSPLLKVATILPESGFKEDLADLEGQLGKTAKGIVAAGQAIGADLQPAVEEFIPFLFQTTEATDETRKEIVKFAHMSGKELEEWSDETKQSFESYVINLEKVQEETDFTRKDLRESFQAMLEHARDLNQAMKTLSREHWINDDFVKFLAEQPDKLILFANSNEKQQQQMQAQWEKSGEILKNQINDRLDVMTGVLDKLDKGETKHVIDIEYRYSGFDPSKPGMNHPGPQ